MPIDTIDSAIAKAKRGLVFVRKEIKPDGEIIYKRYELEDKIDEFFEKQQKDPYLVSPDEDKTYKYVWQRHFRGRSSHVDFRAENVDKEFLVGWTLADAIVGAIKEPVETVGAAHREDAKAANWKIDYKTGKFKPRKTRAGTIVPAQLRAFPKAPEPKQWLTVEGVTPEFPAPGSTKEFRGVFTILDKGAVEYLAQKNDTHEYALSGGKIKGRLMIRRLARVALQKGTVVDEDEGVDAIHAIVEYLGIEEMKQEAVLPPGTPEERRVSDVLWVAIQPIDQTPIVLTKREVDKKWMPVDGISALPKAVRSVIPEKYRYWKQKGSEARKTRDALVEAIKKKEVEIDFDKLLLKELSEEDVAGKLVQRKINPKARFVLQHHTWRGPRVVRAGPSVQHWDFRVDHGEPTLSHFTLQGNPLKQDSISATFKKDRDKKAIDLEVLPPPGAVSQAELKEHSIPFNTPLNPTKATPAFIQVLDRGAVTVLEDTPVFKKYDIKSGKMKGLWVAERADPKTAIWTFKKSTLPAAKKTC